MIRNRQLLVLGMLALGVLAQACQSGKDYKTRIQKNRMEKRKHFKYADASPLTNEQKKDFRELNYFSIDTQYRVQADVEQLADQDTFQMAYKNGKAQAYVRFARLTFRLKGEKATLFAYRNVDDRKRESQNPLFIPFYDKTNGKLTYGGGRYLDVKMQAVGDSLTLDFNKAYNPYCAYNDRYACPVPPPENRLDIAIEAGEKQFKAQAKASG